MTPKPEDPGKNMWCVTGLNHLFVVQFNQLGIMVRLSYYTNVQLLYYLQNVITNFQRREKGKQRIQRSNKLYLATAVAHVQQNHVDHKHTKWFLP